MGSQVDKKTTANTSSAASAAAASKDNEDRDRAGDSSSDSEDEFVAKMMMEGDRKKVDDAPDVDVTALQIIKDCNELSRFERETLHQTQKNHVTGFLQEA